MHDLIQAGVDYQWHHALLEQAYTSFAGIGSGCWWYFLSDGFVTLYQLTGSEITSFGIRDGLGMKLAQQAGMKVIIITGEK